MKEQKVVLVVDDEIKITDVIKSFFEASGFRVYCVYSGKAAINKFHNVNPDLIILDLMLPDISGEEICLQIRQESKVPIIMLSAKSQESDTLTGLDLGADDYIKKPFSVKELLSRARAVLRRYDENSEIIADLLTFNNGYIIIDNSSREVKINNAVVALTPAEYKILITLAKNPSRIFTREDLVVRVFGYDYEGRDRAVDTHIKNLRQKIEINSKESEFILTVYGVGYKFGGSVSGD